MLSDDKQIAKLVERWEKVHALWKAASKKSQEAIATYHWNMRDARAEWNRVLVTRMREAIAFRKAEAAHQLLVDFIASTPRHNASK